MEAEGIHNLIEQDHLVQRTCFMHNQKSFSQRPSCDSDPDDLFDELSPLKGILVGDCSKRSFTLDGALAMPIKKRKLQHEELISYNASTDQCLQKNESDKDKITSCPNFGSENLWRSTPNPSEKEVNNKGEIEFNLQSSVLVKTEDSAEWIRLKCFDSIVVDESNIATIFTGGPIQSSAFSVMPHDKNINQYVAIAGSDVIYKNHSYDNTRNLSGIIQFWNLGPLYERKKLSQRPSMELALYHENGIITQMKWCPADCYDKSPSGCQLPRLGLLAVSSSDSSVYIYNVPQPDFMPKLKPSFPIYFTLPSIKLIPLFGGPSSTTKKTMATCIEWEKNGERIVAGYGNGAVCVWMIKFSSFSSSIAVKKTDQPYIIQPYLFFQASGACIESLSFAPFSNHRWLAVSSIDRTLRFFDLHDTSTPFHVVKQGLENSCAWADTFCGVYSSPTLNSFGHLSLSARECCTKYAEKGLASLFDSSTHVAVSEDKNFHAIADMAGTVTVNFLQNFHNSFEASYLTYVIFETEIMALDSIADLELKTSESKLNISGNILSNNSINNMKSTFCTEIKKESSSSSSGFCSPKNGKTIVIDAPLCFEDDAVNLLKSPSKSSTMNEIKDINNNGIKEVLNKPLTFDEETDFEMIKCSEFSEDLMHDLLMVKISNQSYSSPRTLPFNTSKSSAYSDSRGAKLFSDGALITSAAASDETGDTIVYPLESVFSDTSHKNATKSVTSQSKSFDLNEKGNILHENKMHKMNGELPIKTELFAENSLNFSCTEVKVGKFHSSEILCMQNCSLNCKNRNLKKRDSFNYGNNICSNVDHLTSKHSDILRKECHHSKKSPKEIMTLRDTFSQNLDPKGNLNSEKDLAKVLLSLHESVDDPLHNDLESKNLNQSKPLPDLCSSPASNDFIICDRNDKQFPVRALNQSSAASDYSGDTIIYSLQSYDCNKTDANCLAVENPGAISQSLCKSNIENTFHNNLLHKTDEERTTLYASKIELTENCSSFNSERESQSSFISETDSATKSCSSSDKSRSFYWKEFSSSNFHLLNSEYLCDKSEEKNIVLNELPKSDKNLQELSYENLIESFGVVFKNNLDESSNLMKKQDNDIYIKYNPLSVIKTISWDPNEGCQSWFFVGGNSGIGRLVFVPGFIPDINKKPKSINKKKRLNVS
ncbi:uncharacterized protein LOC129976472 [Argiope bruennichi]|uniref:uncharacterized protein LOC129976472 n=1 Tax=Argiope bruennichi TaxID=94029 RepID=UPI002494E2BC|nr:uncharacterized protein LOC129976472 [Argiope bruennichi]XP_055946050.1 uncharacterized protein LOC129976472 [Argiope bruennichi]